MTAEAQKHDIETMRRTGMGNVADILESGRSAEFDEWKATWDTENPDAPSDKDYNYRMMHDQGKMPKTTDDGSLVFLPEDGWINRRGGSWTPGLGGVPIPQGLRTSYELNSKSWQSQGAIARTVRHGLREAYHTVLSEVGRPLIGAMTPLYGSREQAEADIQQAMTPDFLELAQINESETWGGAGEMLGSELMELGAYVALGKSASVKRAVVDTVGAVGKTAIPKSRVQMGKMKDGLYSLARRLEEATDPGIAMAEFLYASNPANEATASAMLGEQLKEWGYEGDLVDFLTSTDDDQYRNFATNMVEGAIFLEAIRTAGRVGLKIPAAVLKKGQDFVMSRYDAAVKELDTIQASLNAGKVGK